ncbi:DUF1385 domain-containing protein [candidate division KSB1 bacterium]|nr:DUF1385 domain-containing protein [candidate division KSB1 bacterium]
MADEKIAVGGQAVIEGVMMRSPERVSVAVRRPDGKIALKNEPYTSFSKRNKMWGLPIIRGGIALIESMVLGIRALTFSGDIAVQTEIKHEQDDSAEWKKKLWLGMTVAFSLIVGMGIFFYLPLILTEWLGAESGLWFNIVDGIIRLTIFLLYLSLILLMKDIRRVFQYHGAEHKSIFAFEDKKPLDIEHARAYRPYHPRCGTSFLLMVMIVSILVFMFLGKPDTIGERLLRLAFVPVIGGISYELIKLSDKKQNNLLVRMFIAPGLWLQRITAWEPDESMLEVAIVALKGSLGEDYSNDPRVVIES